jgi:L-galactose dehydrogenase
MDQTTLGRTGLKVSIAGLGCGGFSRLGQSTGKTEAESVALVRLALDSGITLIDTASAYGTEGIVGQAIATVPRDSFVLATKASVVRDGQVIAPEAVVESLEESLRKLGTDHIDVFQLHGVPKDHYDHAIDNVVPALLRAREQGKFRFLGITENGAGDTGHEVLVKATKSGLFDVEMVAFNMLHRTASDTLFPLTAPAGIATLVMHAVRSIFARPELLASEMRALAEFGHVSAEIGADPHPLDFLVHEGGAESLTDAAYRFARHTPGVGAVLFGTGSPAHLHANIASLSRPKLPEADLARLLEQFAKVSGLGLESHGLGKKPAA